MSKVQVDKVVNLSDDGAPQLTYGAELPVGYGLTGAGGLNITGVVTAASAVFSGNVTIGGTLTYEDVTNIDVVGVSTFAGRMNVNSTLEINEGLNATAGVATFANGLKVSGSQLLVGSGVTIGIAGVSTFSGTSDVHLLDNVQLNVGDASDLVIKHDGTQSQITESGTGLLYINSNTTVIRNSAGNENQITAEGNGAVKLYYDNSAKIETTNDGTVTTGIATATLGAVVSGGTLTIPTVAGTNNNASQAVLFQTSAGVVDGGSGLTYNPANDVLTINGADISAQMFRGSAGSVTLANDNNSSTESVVVTDKVTLNHGGSAVLETTDDGMTVQKGITVRGIEGGDAQIRIEADEADNASDRFRLVATDSAGFFIQSYDGSQYDNLFGGYLNGASELYHNNTKCLETRADAGIEATSGNFIVGTSGRGLQFDTADSGSDQLLDDYEEGDHTAAMTLGSGSITTTHSNTLTYTKVGRLVTVTGRLYVELSASDVTSFQFTLPFTCANVGTKVESMNLFHVFRATAQSNESNEAIRAFRIDGNTNFAKMVDRDNGTYGEFGVTNPHIGVNIQYYTAT